MDPATILSHSDPGKIVAPQSARRMAFETDLIADRRCAPSRIETATHVDLVPAPQDLADLAPATSAPECATTARVQGAMVSSTAMSSKAQGNLRAEATSDRAPLGLPTTDRRRDRTYDATRARRKISSADLLVSSGTARTKIAIMIGATPVAVRGRPPDHRAEMNEPGSRIMGFQPMFAVLLDFDRGTDRIKQERSDLLPA